jgi:hypothetical protein
MTRMRGTVTVEQGRLLFDGVDVAGLAGRVDTPFFLYSQTQIAANVARVREAFSARHAATRVFFAGKACSNLWFLEQVRAAGADVEVNSGGELWKALRAGFAPEQAVFNGVAKSRRELQEAVSAGIAGVVADSSCELRRLEEVAREAGRPARVLPRVDVGVAGGTPASRPRAAARPVSTAARRWRRSASPPPRRTWSSPGCTCTSARRSPGSSRIWRRSASRSTCSTTSSASSAWRCRRSTWAAASPSPIASAP